MARNEEKSKSMLNRWTTGLHLNSVDSQAKRPYLASSVKVLSECEKWRRQVLREITESIEKIQNPGLGEQALRDLNDTINKKFREKRAWERQIEGLGGATSFTNNLFDDSKDGDDGIALPEQ